MKKFFTLMMLFALGILTTSAQATLEYESKPSDLIQIKCYTLANGMHVYLHENHDTPRIETSVVVRAGSMQDPKDCTGLAHYMEHLLFNGTSKIGTLDYEKERPLLVEIEQLFEQYRTTDNEAQRKAIYARIDSLSYEASKFAILNEYNDILNEIGAVNVNAFTSDKNTNFVSNIPNYEIERWAKLQSHIFSDFVIRGFHTELEAVYEEFNTSIHDDIDRIWEANSTMLYPEVFNPVKIIGTQHDLKNPSITQVYDFFHKYYVPENMAVCMSGDFNMNDALQIVDRYFGQLKPGDGALKFPAVEEIQPGNLGYKYDVYGSQKPQVYMSWRMPKPTDERSQSTIRYICDLLCNSNIGIAEGELVDSHLLKSIEVSHENYRDFSNLTLVLTPQAEDQPELAVLYAMHAIDSLAYGNWDESLLDGIRKYVKRTWLAGAKNNPLIISCFAEDFTNCRRWSSVEEDDSLFAEIGKEEIQEFVQKWMRDDNLCVVYKRQGENTDLQSFTKPEITTLADNKGKRSALGREILAMPTTPLEPVFPDFAGLISEHKLPDGNTLLYMRNTEDDLYSFATYYDVSSKDIPLLHDAIGVMSLSVAEGETIQQRRFCNGFDETGIDIQNGYCTQAYFGLNENFAKATEIVRNYGSTPDNISDNDYRNMYEQQFAFKELSKTERDFQLAELVILGMYGKKNAYDNLPTLKDYKKAKPSDFFDAYHELDNYQHTVAYYGPSSVDSVLAIIQPYHRAGTTPKVSKSPAYVPQKVTNNEVWLKDYPGDNTTVFVYSCNGDEYRIENDYMYTLFNNYIGTSDLTGPLMNEMRTKRSLCYSASIEIEEEAVPGTPYYIDGKVDCQCDKLMEAINTFRYVIEEMPLSEERFEKVKANRLNELVTVRHMREEALGMYWLMKRYNVSENLEELEYNALKNTTFEDFKAFYENTIRNRKYRYIILGSITPEQKTFLKTLGKVKAMK